MANEITVSASLRLQLGVLDVSLTKSGLQVNISGSEYTKLVQNVGTSEEQLDFGDVATPGYCFLRNLDATNYVEIRPATGVADLIRLNAGEIALFRFAHDCTAPFAIANTAACRLEIYLIEA